MRARGNRLTLDAECSTSSTTYKHFRNVPPMKPPFTPNLDIGIAGAGVDDHILWFV
jgi:hypothetical protein